ncbi:MAG: hypothetical protein IPF82_11610 [Blastocatellia bacterium]|nr:hypothetical protein [Blastocatellia bacterium]
MPKLVLSACGPIPRSVPVSLQFLVRKQRKVDKANKLVNEGNVIQTEAEKLFSESTGKYDAIVKEAQSAENTFEELANKEEPLKALLSLETAAEQVSRSRASQKTRNQAESGRLVQAVPVLRGELLRKETSPWTSFQNGQDHLLDRTSKTEEDFAAKLKEQQTALENLGKQKVDLKAKVDKLTADHKDDFKQQ